MERDIERQRETTGDPPSLFPPAALMRPDGEGVRQTDVTVESVTCTSLEVVKLDTQLELKRELFKLKTQAGNEESDDSFCFLQPDMILYWLFEMDFS